MTSDSWRVLFTDLGYTVYQQFPNQPVGGTIAIDVTAEPTGQSRSGGQRFTRRLVGHSLEPAAPGSSLEAVAEKYMRRVLDLVVNEGVKVKPDAECAISAALSLSRDELRRHEQQAEHHGSTH